MQTKEAALEGLRTIFRNVLATSAAGGSGSCILRGQGYVDGYMRALLELGIATRAELLHLIAVERERANGPAVRDVDRDNLEDGAAPSRSFGSNVAA